jgi:lipopolysaccharide export system protein LptC
MIVCAQGWRDVNIKQRLRRHFVPAAGTTRFVLLGRNFLWLMIVAVIALIFYTASDNNTSDNTRLVFSQIKQMGDMQNVMKNPYYHGFDKNNMPYSVTADHAVQQDAETVTMVNIKADMQTKGNKWLALHAGAGEMKTETRMLKLTKNVDMFYDGGYEFRSDHALVDINKGEAYGDTPVTGQGPMGTLEANSFSVFSRGDVILFEGNVKVRIYR